MLRPWLGPLREGKPATHATQEAAVGQWLVASLRSGVLGSAADGRVQTVIDPGVLGRVGGTVVTIAVDSGLKYLTAEVFAGMSAHAPTIDLPSRPPTPAV